MNVPFVDLRAQYRTIKDEIDQAVAQVLDQTAFIGGTIVERFEAEFARYTGSEHCISCANGTDALEIALEALGIGPGDEVIVPAYTWISTASAVSRVGATPVFAEVHPEYYTIDPLAVEKKIGKHTRCILPVHFYGLPSDMPAIMEVAERHDLVVLEDCAQAHGARINGKLVGTFGEAATYSFYPGKNLGAYGDAGAIVSSNAQLVAKCRQLARLGQEGKHNHVAIGRNSRMDTLQAAVLRVKLAHLQSWTEKRRAHARSYSKLLNDSEIDLPKEPTGFHHVYHIFMVQLDNRDRVQELLSSHGVSTQLHYPRPLPRIKPYATSESFPVSDAMAARMLSLPMYAELTSEQVEYVASKLIDTL